jgi:tetratricopeptide (TPR) repeat protein
MSATPIYRWPGGRFMVVPQWVVFLRPDFSSYWCFAAAFLCLISPNAPAQTDPRAPGNANFADRAEKTYKDARRQYLAATNDTELAWRFGRACFDWADEVTTSEKRAEIANEGIAACRAILKNNSKSAPGHYYLAMDLGQLARTKTLGALKLVTEMESEFNRVVELDSHFDFAGPDRNLGLLYGDAPGWPVSVGDKSKAREHFEKALKLAPDYPENHLNLIESELAWGDKKSAASQLAALDELWPEAQKKFTGDAWASSWPDWEKRRNDAKKKLAPPVK